MLYLKSTYSYMENDFTHNVCTYVCCKDVVKCKLKRLLALMSRTGKLIDRSGWIRLIWERCNTFEHMRTDHFNKERAFRKGEIKSVPKLLGPQHTDSNCGKVTLSSASLASQVRLYQRRQVQTPVIVTLPERPSGYLCEFWDKSCKSFAGLKHHKTVHRERYVSNIFSTDKLYVCYVCK